MLSFVYVIGRAAFTFLTSALTSKFVLISVILTSITVLLDLLLTLLPSWFSGADTLSSLSLNPLGWYLIDYFRLQEGLALIMSAYVTRFLIRRIPFIG